MLLVPIYKRGDNIEGSHYRGLLLLPATYKMLSIILFSRVTPYVDEITVDHRCGFWHNGSTSEDILHSSDAGEEWECFGRVYQIFIGLEKAYGLVMSEIFYNTRTEIVVLMNLIILIKMCSNETCSKFHIGKNSSDALLFRTVLNRETLYWHCFSTLI
jgi:hypothetical protein